MLVSELYDGATILLEESSGTYSSYTLMQHNYNSGKALLWRDASIGSVKWRTSTVSYYNNLYQTSYLDSYLNDTWYPSLLSTTRNSLTTLSYPVADYNNGGNPTSITRNAATVSATELGLVVDSNYGSTLDYAVAGIIDRDVNYWTRQPVNSSSTVYYVYADGSRDSSSCTVSYAVFPTVGLSESMSVEWDGTLGGYKLSSTTSSAPTPPAALYLNGGAYNYGEVEPGTSFTLSWDASTSSSVIGYTVYYKDTGDTTYTAVGTVTSLSKTVYAPDSYSTTRTFYVRAISSDNYVSDYSTATRYVTTKAAPTVSIPTPPASVYLYDGTLEGNFSGVELGKSFTLSWSASSSSSVSYYKVGYKDNGSTAYTIVDTTTSLQMTVYASSAYSTTRTFYVAAVNSSGISSEWSTASRSVATKDPPASSGVTAPTSLYFSGYTGDVTDAELSTDYILFWSGATGSISGYEVHLSTPSSNGYYTYSTTSSVSSGIQITTPNTYSTTWSFKVRAVGSDGSYSSFVGPISITTKAEPVSVSATIPYYNGSAWLDATPWYYNGSSWISPKMWYYNGIDWLPIPPLPKYSATVEAVSGAAYGFVEQSDGYWESNNKGYDSSYAMCKIKIVTDGTQAVYVDCINYAESSWDYGILSNVDTTLSLSSEADSVNVKHSFYGMSQDSVQSVYYGVLSAGEHYIYVKYRKDSSSSINNDSLKFKVRFVQPLSECSYIVSALTGASRFALNSNGYYESVNQGDDYNSTYALCKVNIVADGVRRMYVDCINYAEQNWDYGLLSELDQTLDANSVDGSANVKQSFKTSSMSSVQTVDYGVPAAGEHYIYAKYLKDNSGYAGNDSLQFKVRFE